MKGLDSSFVKVRPVEGGVSTIDYLFPLIWIFEPIINNLAHIGYDSNNTSTIGCVQFQRHDGDQSVL